MTTQQDAINNDYQRSLEAREPFVLLRPNIMPDGDKWCVLYGDDLQTGVAGFGDTPELAAVDFNRAWTTQKSHGTLAAPRANRRQTNAAIDAAITQEREKPND